MSGGGQMSGHAGVGRVVSRRRSFDVRIVTPAVATFVDCSRRVGGSTLNDILRLLVVVNADATARTPTTATTRVPRAEVCDTDARHDISK